MPGFVHTNPERRRKRLAMSLDAASARMVWAIDQGRPYAAFPWSLRLPLALLRLAPAALADRLLRIGHGHTGKRAPRVLRPSHL